MNIDKRLLVLLYDHRLRFALAVACGVLSAFFIIFQAWFLSQIIDQVFIDSASLVEIEAQLSILLVVFLLRTLFNFLSDLSASSYALRIKSKLRSDLYNHLIQLGPNYTNSQRTGELNAVLIDGIESIETYLSQYLPGLVLAAVIPFIYLIFVFPLDHLTGIILLVTAPLIPLFMVLIGDKSQDLTHHQWNSLRSMSAYFLDTIQGLKTLKALGRSQGHSQAISQVSDQYRKTTMGVLRVTFLSALALELVATISIAIIAVEVGLRLLVGSFNYQPGLFLLLLVPEFYLPLRSLGARFHAGMSGTSAAKRIFEILDTPVSHAGGEGATQIDIPPLGEIYSISSIKCENVCYEYPGNRPALNGIYFTIDGGQTTILTGKSGAGKSTLVDLLLGFIHAQDGSILINGIPLGQIPVEVWRKQIAWLPHKPYIFNDSVLANIRFAKPEASPLQIQYAARQANVEGFTQKLPDGYDTIVGENGAKLSRGQAQRIALARALLKNAPFNIFDEPATNLDPHNEKLLKDSLGRLPDISTNLIIAHRFNTIKNADRIIFLENGRVVENGNDSIWAKSSSTYTEKLVGDDSPIDNPTSGDPSLFERESTHTAYVQETSFDTTSLSILNQPEFAAGLPGAQFHPKTGFKILRRLLNLVSPHKRSIVLSAMVGFAAIASGIGLMATSAYIISAAALQPSIAELQLAIVGVRFLGISRSVFRYLERYTSHQTTFKLLAEFRVWFYKRLEPLVPARTSSLSTGDLLARLQGDIQSLESFYVRGIAPPITAGLITLCMGIVFFLVNPAFGLTIFLFLSLSSLVLPVFIRILSRSPARKIVGLSAELNTLVVDGIQGLPDLLVYQQASRHAARIHRASEKLAAAQFSLSRLDSFQSSMIFLFTNICAWALIILAVPQVGSGELNGVWLASLILASLSAFEAVLPIPLAARHLEANITAARRLFEVADTRAEVLDPSQPLEIPAKMDINISRLNFRYPPDFSSVSRTTSARNPPQNHSPLVLDQVSLNLKHGNRVAVVGPSGGGKSTIAHLLLRFWEYEGHNSIRVNGSQLCQFKQVSMRRSCGTMLQDNYIFNSSIRQNILIARPDATITEIKKAACAASLDGFISSLQRGYNTVVGERGLLLSAGEQQRICLARVFLSDAPLIILDEPTSHLDRQAQRAVMQAIKDFTRGRSLLMFTHRYIDLGWLDEILVLDGGRIIEKGHFDQLLSKGGIFRRMHDLQSQVVFEGQDDL